MKLQILPLSILMLGCIGMDIRSVCQNSLDLGVRDKCFSVVAFNDDNITECGAVQNSTIRDYCVMKIAIADLSLDDCSSMTSLKDQCTHVVMGLQENNSLVCRLIQDNDTEGICMMRV
jgi:hypothetical protein